jgi:hypothetical protein
MEFCLFYLLAESEIVQHKVIIALRATAVRLSLGHDLVRRVQDVLGK